MAKKLQLQIPIPCHENWENMTPTEKGRFCASCQKQVVDFSNKSDRDIAMFFKRPSTGSVCGRFMEDQLNRNIDIPKKRIPWLKYFFQFLIPALFISYRANAQGKVKVVTTSAAQSPKPSATRGHNNSQGKIVHQVCSTIGDVEIKSASYNDFNVSFKTPQVFDTIPQIMCNIWVELPGSIKGKVIDDAGNPIAFATIVIKGTQNAVVADANGIFSITPNDDWKEATFVASYIGFETVESQVRRANYNDGDTILLAPMKLQILGKIVEGRITEKDPKPIPLLRWIFKDTAFTKFRIYPNPIRSNSTLNIEWKQKDPGAHLLQLFNQSGQLVFSKEINISEGSKLVTVNTPSVIAGNYYLKLTSKGTGKSYTEKLIIE